MVADAYFSKEHLHGEFVRDGFALVNRFRNDTVLFYLTLQKPTGKRGKPKLYDRQTSISTTGNSIPWSKSLKRKVRPAICYDREGSSNTATNGKDIIQYYCPVSGRTED
ncbi:MAG: hypothetical protein BGO34_05135 [Bacteroidia bacterium 44-10]|nr:MAG: hypothetical protein BGO34_05135 [Bacteroidia bacterium 44-10]